MSEATPSAQRPSPSADAQGPQAPDFLGALLPLLIAFTYLAFWELAPRIPSDSNGAVVVSTIISLGLVIWLAAQFAHTVRRPTGLVINALLAGALVIPVQASLVAGKPLVPWIGILRVPGLFGAMIIWLASSLGGLLAFIVRGANMIPPIAAVLAVVDIWTVLLGGPVQRTLQSSTPAARAVARAMTAPLPIPKAAIRGAAPYPVVGFADFLFVAFFVAAIGRFVPTRTAYLRTLYGLIGILCLYMLVVLLWPGNVSLPALLPMAVLVIAIHWRHFHYERSELFALLYAGLFIALIALGFWYFARRQPPPSRDEGPRALRPGPRLARLPEAAAARDQPEDPGLN